MTLIFQEDPAVHEDYSFAVEADALGNIEWDHWSPEDHDLGVRFYLTAQGSQSRAQTTFTDAKATLTTITSDINPSAIGQQVTFTASVTETTGGGGVPGTVVTVGSVNFREGGNNCNNSAAGRSFFAVTSRTRRDRAIAVAARQPTRTSPRHRGLQNDQGLLRGREGRRGPGATGSRHFDGATTYNVRYPA